ncbi:hypothetical protein J6S88_01580 [bacterium]|nr:hypothetical protein [bacterium]
MEVNSATATQTQSTTQTQTTTTSNNKVNEQSSSASFESEMKNAQKETDNKTKSEDKVAENKEQTKVSGKETEIKMDASKTENVKENLIAKNINEKFNEKRTKLNPEAEFDPAEILSVNIQNLIDTQNIISGKNELFNISITKDVDLSKNIGETLDYSNIEMTADDAKFFADIVQNNEGGIQNVMAEIQQAVNFGDEAVQKTATVSKALLDALQNTVKTGQAVRIDFGNDIAVVMRVSKDGSVMANFIPGDKAVENYLKNNIDFLRQRFEEEDIPYSQLSYSQHQQKEKRQQNKENRNE